MQHKLRVHMIATAPLNRHGRVKVLVNKTSQAGSLWGMVEPISISAKSLSGSIEESGEYVCFDGSVVKFGVVIKNDQHCNVCIKACSPRFV